MGTNYYAHENVCPCCGRAELVRHIGKSSAGWQFVWRGWPGACDFGDPFVAGSYADWRAYLAGGLALIRDEYGRDVDFDEFFEMVDAEGPGSGLRGGSGCSYGLSEYYRNDPEGWRFCFNEFS